MRYLMLQSHTALRTDPYKVAVPKGSGSPRARGWGGLHEGLAHRCPNLGVLQDSSWRPGSSRFPFHRNPLRIPTTGTGRHIYKASPRGRAAAAPRPGPAPPRGPPQIPGGTLPPNAPSPGQRGAGRPPARPRLPRLPLRLRAVPADGRAAAGEAPSSPRLGSPRASPAGAGGRPALAGRGNKTAARQRGSALPRDAPAERGWLRITGRGEAPATSPRVGARAAPCVGITRAAPPWPGGGARRRCQLSPPPRTRCRRGRPLTFPGAAAPGGARPGRRGGGPGRGGAGQPEHPRPCGPPPAGEEALTLPNHLFRRGRGRRDGGGVAWPTRWCGKYEEAWCPPRPEGEPGQKEGRLELRGCGEGPGKCPSPGPPRSSAAQNLKV